MAEHAKDSTGFNLKGKVSKLTPPIRFQSPVVKRTSKPVKATGAHSKKK